MDSSSYCPNDLLTVNTEPVGMVTAHEQAPRGVEASEKMAALFGGRMRRLKSGMDALCVCLCGVKSLGGAFGGNCRVCLG